MRVIEESTMSDKLLPCPFCGGKARLHVNDPQADDRKHNRVHCDNCGADGPHDTWFTLEGVTEMWNKRSV